MYTILLPKCSADTRNFVGEILQSRGVETRPVFYPMHLLPPYQEDWTLYPEATECGARGINLPTHELVSEEEVAYICEQLGSAIRDVGLNLRAVA
jgi:perosamine synthetase